MWGAAMRATGTPVPVRGRGAPGVGRAAARARPSARLDSGLSAADFALEREVGSLSVDTTVEVASLNEGGDALSGLSLTRGLETSREDGVVRVFAARLEGPREIALGRRCFVLLKEYPPGARSIAEAEVAAYEVLLSDGSGDGNQGVTFEAGALPTLSEPPVEPLLGAFEAVGVDSGQGAADAVGAGRSLWLAYRVGLGGLRWGDLPRPLGMAAADLGRALRAEVTPRPATSNGGASALMQAFGGGGEKKPSERDLKRVAAAYEAAGGRLRELVRGAVGAVAFVHAGGIVHRALSAESLLVVSVDQRGAPPTLRVLVANLGFSAVLPDPRTDAEFEDVRQVLGEDSHALGLALATVVVQALMMPAPDMGEQVVDDEELQQVVDELQQVVDDEELQAVPATVRRLLGGMPSSEEGDVRTFRGYAEAEPRWERACEFLSADDDAGWDLIERLACKRQALREIVASGNVLSTAPTPEPSAAYKAAAEVSEKLQKSVDEATKGAKEQLKGLFDGLL